MRHALQECNSENEVKRNCRIRSFFSTASRPCIPQKFEPTLFCICAALWLTSSIQGHAASGVLELTISDQTTGGPIPCRIHLKDQEGKPVFADGLPKWRDHFVCNGKAKLELPSGRYTYQVERGPEYKPATGSITLSSETNQRVAIKLSRLADLAVEGWWSGELHVHRPIQEMELLMQAEDLHIAPVITW